MDIVKSARKLIWRVIGLDRVYSEIETLQYFLNIAHKPSDFKETNDGDLKILQDCDMLLLSIFDTFCKKNNLSYWLDYGTLLGYVRHGGFIPWDDDMDVSMPRDDYQKAIVLLKEQLEPLGISVTIDRQIGIGYRHQETGIWLDVFAVDSYYTNKENNVDYNELRKKICQCGKQCRKNVTSEEKKLLQRQEIIGGTDKLTDGNCLLYLSPEFSFPYDNHIYRHDDIFPLTRAKWNNFEVNIPVHYKSVLEEEYGLHYMQFPKSGVLHHDLGRGPLSQWANKNRIDMQKIMSNLSLILDTFK